MRDDDKIRQAMVCLRDAQHLLKAAHMPQTAGGVTRLRVWLRWCLHEGRMLRDDMNDRCRKDGIKSPDTQFSEKRSTGRKRGRAK